MMVVGDSTSVLSVTSTGRIEATGAVNGGMITMQGGSIHAAVGSVLDAGGGVNGGTVAIIREKCNGVVNLNGRVGAAGGSGNGGVVNVAGAGDVNVGRGAVMDAAGATGGVVSIDGAGTTMLEGTVNAVGNTGTGGTANVTGANVVVAVNAELDVSGLTGEGRINVGGGFQGRDGKFAQLKSTVVGGKATMGGRRWTAGTWHGGGVVERGHDFPGRDRGAGDGRGGAWWVCGGVGQAELAIQQRGDRRLVVERGSGHGVCSTQATWTWLPRVPPCRSRGSTRYWTPTPT